MVELVVNEWMIFKNIWRRRRSERWKRDGDDESRRALITVAWKLGCSWWRSEWDEGGIQGWGWDELPLTPVRGCAKKQFGRNTGRALPFRVRSWESFISAARRLEEDEIEASAMAPVPGQQKPS
jgi:hypothetical protein